MNVAENHSQSLASKTPSRLVLGGLIVVSVLTIFVLTGCGSGGTAPVEAKKTPVEAPPKEAIAVLYYAEDSPFNAAFREGAKAAAEEKKVEIEWFDAKSETDQVELLNRVVKEKYAAVCVCPLKPDVLKEAVGNAKSAKIPVIVCERPLSLDGAETSADTVFVASDHAYCGQIIAEQATKMIDDDGKLLLIGGEIGVEADRAMNVAYALKETKIEVIAESDVSTDGVAAVMTKFMKDNEDSSVAVVAVSASGAQEVLKWKASEAGEDFEDLPVLGFGSWDETAEAMTSGALSAVVLEDPAGIGSNTVLSAVNAVAGGESSGNLVTVGEHLVTPENLEDERTVDLLKSNVR